ncbi:hypothetical protein AMECASPLE_029104 [Ameca splendens]|uniref:Uncharacterized protein n=1 Tax=Ameca splendens TaxID=208324 RepID=A0ABV1A152_9TELE
MGLLVGIWAGVEVRVLGGCLVLKLALRPSQDRLDCLGSQSLASVPGPSVGEASGSSKGVLAGWCAVLSEMWLRIDGGAGQLPRCCGVCRAEGRMAGIPGLLRCLGVGLAGCPVFGML